MTTEQALKEIKEILEKLYEDEGVFISSVYPNYIENVLSDKKITGISADIQKD